MKRIYLQECNEQGTDFTGLGYAESYMVNDKFWAWRYRVDNSAGSALEKEIQKIFDLIAKGKGQQGMIDFIAFELLIEFKG